MLNHDDIILVDPTAGTGEFNRWHTQMGQPVHHPDQGEADQKFLVYDPPPLETDLEITGHPVIHLNVRSTATDGQFYAYLETILPDGRVECLTDGQLRAIHRMISDDLPPYTMFGPYHTFERKDTISLVPGEVADPGFPFPRTKASQHLATSMVKFRYRHDSPRKLVSANPSLLEGLAVFY